MHGVWLTIVVDYQIGLRLGFYIDLLQDRQSLVHQGCLPRFSRSRNLRCWHVALMCVRVALMCVRVALMCVYVYVWPRIPSLCACEGACVCTLSARANSSMSAACMCVCVRVCVCVW